MRTPQKSIGIIRQRFGETVDREAVPNELDALCNIGESSPDVALPPAISRLIAQRGAVKEKRFNSAPRPGQILRVPPRAADNSAASPNEFMAVLIDSQQTAEKWRGWLVGRDPEYATEWDLILGPEDDPRDPMCQVIQVWNPLSLAWKESDQVLAELTPDRLAAVRSLASDFGRHEIPVAIEDTRMGVLIARELSDGTGVVTGTPISGVNDPRSEYQTIYREAALWISVGAPVTRPVHAELVKEKPQPWLWLKRLLTGSDNHFSGWRIGGALATLVVVPLVYLLVSGNPHEQAQIATQSISVESKPEFRYISSGVIQELRAVNPEALAQKIENRLLQLGAHPEIRSSGPELVSLFVDIGKLSEVERLAVLKDFQLGIPTDGMLRVDIYQATENSSPVESSRKSK